MEKLYSTTTIATIIDGKLVAGGERFITHLLYDSRRVQQPESSLFFAIKTAHNDGHRYLHEAHQKGVRAFVVSEEVLLDDAVVIRVPDTLAALQTLAAYHRGQYNIPVIGITGSNGKTIVKEWLNQLLEEEETIVRSPKSFNSQLGVALSVWEMGPQHTLGIFEAGISQGGEMEALEIMIRPTIAVLTNLGEAHSEGFSSHEEKLREKRKLFSKAEVVIGPKKWLEDFAGKTLTWSFDTGADVHIRAVKKGGNTATIEGTYGQQPFSITIPFTDEASVENAITCLCVLWYLKKGNTQQQTRFAKLHPVDMRLRLQHAINNCLLINDSYSADLTSLTIALHFLAGQSSGKRRTVILSDFYESGRDEALLYREIAGLLKAHRVEKLLVIGERKVVLTSKQNFQVASFTPLHQQSSFFNNSEPRSLSMR